MIMADFLGIFLFLFAITNYPKMGGLSEIIYFSCLESTTKDPAGVFFVKVTFPAIYEEFIIQISLCQL